MSEKQIDLLIGNDMTLYIDDLADENGSPVTGATVTVTLKDLEGTELTGQAWPQVASEPTPGNYQLPLEDTIAAEAGGEYRAHITALATDGGIAEWSRKTVGKIRS